MCGRFARATRALSERPAQRTRPPRRPWPATGRANPCGSLGVQAGSLGHERSLREAKGMHGAGELESTVAGTTVSLEGVSVPERARSVPGAVLVFASGAAQSRVFRVEAGSLELGRLELAVGGSDPLISRRHVRLTRERDGFVVADLGSRNGTHANGLRLGAPQHVPYGGVVRAGGALLLLLADIVPFEHYGLGAGAGVVGGPSLRRALESIERVARSPGRASNVLILGETGTGKELAAQAFHAAEERAPAAFTAVNCATIPRELAERLLFGSKRGAFSGATDAMGYVQSAHGGTLFLDEIAELPLDVQSKLLRVIESREVQRLGATQHDPVDVRFCAATWRDLRAEVGAGRFRDDLYFRIGQPEVRLPPLRERREEIPWHIQQVLSDAPVKPTLAAAAGFVEACMLRHWPGNVRELRGELRRVALTAPSAGAALGADALSPTAGLAIARSAGDDATPHELAAPRVERPEPSPSVAGPPPFPRDEIAEAMAREGGNVTSAARRLGVHRNKVRRWLERHRVDARQFKLSGKTTS